ncbi:hypothetical protein SAMN05216359_106193 [Roseateles sp. YR242]|uniref:hypothetical protein n=1 Tax=Roseateles sp. YR242 TaxID=1855305 RepID=UPI0008D85854|nr:hypothetical protein [Roseateles sp. YR242]SEL21909.1 hypothetical protein SAMN05216359_106193 [Roseateles sp. YR242]
MTSIASTFSSAGAGWLDRIAASRGLAARQASLSGGVTSSSGGTSGVTQVTLGAANGQDAGPVVYTRPVYALQPQRAWGATPEKGDTISALMSRNLGNSATLTLADQWRGLGGALLSRFAQAPETYQQSLVSYLAPVADAAGVEGVGAADAAAAAVDDSEAAAAQALSGLATGAATVGMSIRTRSGEAIELKILVNSGASGGPGLQVEIRGSDKLSAEEKDAVAGLASGLDKALEGLGQRKAARLDLSGLTGFDSGVLAGIDLKVENPQVGAAVESFALHLGTDKRTLALDGAAGEVNLVVDAAMPLGDVAPVRRWASIHQYLEKMEAAGARSHVDRQVLEQMKDAFRFLQAVGTPPEDEEAPKAGSSGSSGSSGTSGSSGPAGASAPSGAGVADGTEAVEVPRETAAQALQSGLADFDVSFESDFRKLNRYGAAREAGHARYHLSQSTVTTANAVTGGQSIGQTVSEQLESTWQRSLDGGTLRVDLGNYTAHVVKDSSTVATLIEASADGVAHGLRKTDRQQSQADSTIVDHHLAGTTGTPVHQTWVERLFR